MYKFMSYLLILPTYPTCVQTVL